MIGGGRWSFLHLEDAASATERAIETGAPGVYNIVDDEPAPVREWLPALAAMLGAKPPRRIAAFLARIAVGEHLVAMMTRAAPARTARRGKRSAGGRPTPPGGEVLQR
jgi:nucleoside-diphosphate-sugar epimerase